MFESFDRVAQKVATNSSRRQFLGRFGRGALVAAGALGAMLAFPSDAMAGRRCPEGYRYCRRCGCVPTGTRCKCEPR
jgi:hypothetical protein